MESVKMGWGFEVQRFKIIPKSTHKIQRGDTFTAPDGSRFDKEGSLWVPSSRLITGHNVVIDLAQIELMKAWSVIQGSVREIEFIAVGDGLTDPTDSDTTLTNELESKGIDSWDDALIVPDSSGLSLRKATVVW